MGPQSPLAAIQQARWSVRCSPCGASSHGCTQLAREAALQLRHSGGTPSLKGLVCDAAYGGLHPGFGTVDMANVSPQLTSTIERGFRVVEREYLAMNGHAAHAYRMDAPREAEFSKYGGNSISSFLSNLRTFVL